MANESRYEIRCQTVKQRDDIKSILVRLEKKLKKTRAGLIYLALQELEGKIK